MMDEIDKHISEKAVVFANKRKKEIARRLTNVKMFNPDIYPISVFMAGSPGAGKTESSLRLIEVVSAKSAVLRIDLDEYRKYFSDYNGANSELFQAGCSIIADKVHDFALKNNQSFVFDGTFTNLERSIQNIKRSLNKKRGVFILYVYQDPVQAWNFVLKRAERDGRFIPKEAFINKYFTARENVNMVKSIFGSSVQIDLVVKNIDGTDFRYKENIASIDSHLKETYSKEELMKFII
ncbi:MAG: hypothetical protein RLZZ230_960 [Candidatus Parcubacteria bacterium]|jgi:hypothetical protein